MEPNFAFVEGQWNFYASRCMEHPDKEVKVNLVASLLSNFFTLGEVNISVGFPLQTTLSRSANIY